MGQCNKWQQGYRQGKPNAAYVTWYRKSAALAIHPASSTWDIDLKTACDTTFARRCCDVHIRPCSAQCLFQVSEGCMRVSSLTFVSSKQTSKEGFKRTDWCQFTVHVPSNNLVMNRKVEPDVRRLRQMELICMSDQQVQAKPAPCQYG
jgi:hypothetical protein